MGYLDQVARTGGWTHAQFSPVPCVEMFRPGPFAGAVAKAIKPGAVLNHSESQNGSRQNVPFTLQTILFGLLRTSLGQCAPVEVSIGNMPYTRDLLLPMSANFCGLPPFHDSYCIFTTWSQSLELNARPERRSQITLQFIILNKKSVNFLNLLFFPGRFYCIFGKLSVLQNCNIWVIFKDTDIRFFHKPNLVIGFKPIFGPLCVESMDYCFKRNASSHHKSKKSSFSFFFLFFLFFLNFWQNR